jgi:tetratricopeptide (TPR) repeat protein
VSRPVRRPVRSAVWLCGCVLALGLGPSRALAWEWFRSESSAVERGNAHFKAKRYDEAVKAYDEALREHPDEPGVQLDRGTALLAQKSYGPARDALRSASRGHVDPEIRSRALYNLGLSFLDEANTLASGEDPKEAQGRLRESVDAFKAALRAKPGNADAAWNLDLARRRLVELEEQQKKEDEQKQDDQKKDEQNKDDSKKEQQNKDEQNKPPESDPDAGPDDGGAGEPKPGDGERDAGSPEPSEPEGAPDGGPGAGRDASAPQPAEAGDAGASAGSSGEARPAEPSRDAMDRALDALREGEESFQKHRAGARARTRPERVLKDW